MWKSRLPALIALLATPALSADTVYVIDSSGAGDFLEIADALPSVGQDDVLLVRPGNYSADVLLADHAITIIADGTGPVVFDAELRVQSLGAARNVTVHGLELMRGFSVEDCTGPVRFELCRTPATSELAPPPPGLNYLDYKTCGIGESLQTVTSSPAVTFVDCEFVGRSGASVSFGSGYDGAPGQHGLLVTDSTVLLYDCALTGGDGSDGNGQVHSSAIAGAGGDGLRLRGNSLARLTRGSRVGGSGGVYAPGSDDLGTVPGCDGVDARADNPSGLVPTTHPDLRFNMPAVLVSSVPGPLTVQGPPGALAVHLFSMGDARRLYPAFVGVFHLTSPFQATTLGQIPASGLLTSSFVDAGPNTPQGVRNLHSQVYVRNNGALFLSQPRRSIVIDPGL